MTLRFTPPPEDAKSLPKYGSYVVGSGLKVHRRLGDAKNSFGNRGWHRVPNPEWKEGDSYYKKSKVVTQHSFILENVDGIWYTLYEIAPGLTRDELPWYKEYFRDTTYSWDKGTPVELYSEYNKNIQAKDPGRYVFFKKHVPMSTEEYVAWRLRVQLEVLGVQL